MSLFSFFSPSFVSLSTPIRLLILPLLSLKSPICGTQAWLSWGPPLTAQHKQTPPGGHPLYLFPPQGPQSPEQNAQLLLSPDSSSTWTSDAWALSCRLKTGSSENCFRSFGPFPPDIFCKLNVLCFLLCSSFTPHPKGSLTASSEIQASLTSIRRSTS